MHKILYKKHKNPPNDSNKEQRAYLTEMIINVYGYYKSVIQLDIMGI